MYWSFDVLFVCEELRVNLETVLVIWVRVIILQSSAAARHPPVDNKEINLQFTNKFEV